MKLLLLASVLALNAIIVASVPKWCVYSSTALERCQNVSRAMSNSLSCVKGSDEKDCYKKINNKQADFGAFDGGMIYEAGKEHNMKVVMAEKESSGPASSISYYAVAAVKANSSLALSKLKGKKSCHTGVGKTAGWKVPVGTLMRKNYMSCEKSDVVASVAAYFSASCAPGANNPKYNPKKYGATKLCSLCIGKGANKCKRGSDEPYYNYHGALKCLKDGAGDVAFVKHSTLTSLPSAESAKYKILCPDETRGMDVPSAYPSCNLAMVPTHGVLTRPDGPVADIQKVLMDADAKFGHNTTNSVKLYGDDGVLFSKKTVGLDIVLPAKQQYEKYLDTAYISILKNLDQCSKQVSGAVGLACSFSLLLLMFAVFAFFY